MPQFWLQIGLIGLGAGTCSALLFASALSGSMLSLVLFSLAPLPIMIAALGWSHWTGLAAALIAALASAVAISPFYLVSFLVSVGLPAWWLGYLALLARPAGPDGELEWYPAGRLVLWAAILGAVVIMAGLSQLGTGEATIRDTLHSIFEQILRAQQSIPAGEPLSIGGSDPDRLIDLLVSLVPLVAAMLSTLTQFVNLWLAGRIVKLSGRLKRPWPDLAAIRFPPATPIALAAALAASFLPGVIGVAASLPAASLFVAYAALGFAVLHGITRYWQSRAVVLFGVYTAVAFLVWPVLLMSLLGLIDAALDLRGRVAATRGPPAPLA
jgi:hypothetical protein